MQTSDSIKNLAASLLLAQAEFTGVLKDKTNPHFKSKYADLQAAISATEEPLRKHGLLVIQTPQGCVATQSATVVTRLLHSSGEWIQDSLEMPAGNTNRFDAQTVGSAITYARRYSYLGILGIAPEDDDGNVASGHAGPQAVKAPLPSFRPSPAPVPMREPGDDDEVPLFDEEGNLVEHPAAVHSRERKQAAQEATDVPSVKPASGPRINEAQGKRFIAIAKANSKSWDQINAALKSIGVEKAFEIPRDQYDVFIEWAGGKNEGRRA
jgi:hypothetical protein